MLGSLVRWVVGSLVGSLFVALCVLPTPAFAAPSHAGPAGHWEGTIRIPEQPMGITVDLAQTPAGAWIGSMTIPRSTTVDVPLTEIVVDEAGVRFVSYLPKKTTFQGTISAETQALSGQVSSLDGAVPFDLERRGDANVKVPPPSSRLPKAFEGRWEGAMDVSGKVRRIALTLSAAADGTAMATLVSVDRGQEIPVTTVTVNDTQLQLDVRVVSGTYRGTLAANGDLAGEWSEGTTPRLPLTFKRAAAQSK